MSIRANTVRVKNGWVSIVNERKEAKWEMYRCGKCKEPIRADVDNVGIQCEKCGSKIFYKARQNVRKLIKAR